MSGRSLPFIGIPCCLRAINERPYHTVSERYTNAVIDAAGCLPLVIPAIGPKIDCSALLDGLDGLLLTGSPSNVEPDRYGGPPSPEALCHSMTARSVSRCSPASSLCGMWDAGPRSADCGFGTASPPARHL